ncbi:MAG: peptidoglycan DD-metalloendopeptidase family protein [Alphaproteobacteria bacterium]|nr:peptidoglycan DD-metalloendopeptidase family protein [Alphaproteobacteria bacterium]
MRARAAMTEIGRRATAFGQRWFPERQIIVRQQETVRAIRLASGAQMLAASLLLVGGTCTLAAGGAYLLAGSRVKPVETVDTRAKPAPALTEDTTLPQPVVASAETVAPAPDDAVAPVSASVPAAPPLTEAPAAIVAVPDDQSRQLQQDATAAQDRAKELERTLAATRQLLDQAQTARQTALHERDALAARLSDTEKRMHAASAEQEQALNRLTQETRRSIGEVERVFNAVGVDPARLIPQNSPDGHRGGPFVPWDAQLRAQKAPPPRLPDGYGSDIARLDLLLQLLRTMPLAAPVQDFVITSPFGYRKDPFNGEAALHEGIDLQAPRGTPVTATAPGRVTFAGRQSSYGLMVEIEHSNGIHTRYAHLDRIAVKPGEKVGFRQVIGLLGSTGRASGPHVHYEVLVDGRPHDPLNFLKAASNVRKNH